MVLVDDSGKDCQRVALICDPFFLVLLQFFVSLNSHMKRNIFWGLHIRTPFFMPFP